MLLIDKTVLSMGRKHSKITRIIMMIGSCGIIAISTPLMVIYSHVTIAPGSMDLGIRLVCLAGLILLPIACSFIAAITMNSMGKKGDSWLKRLIMTLGGIFLLGAVFLGPIVVRVENVIDEAPPPFPELHQYAGLAVGIIIGGLIIGVICGTCFEKYFRNKSRKEKRFWSGLGIAIITMFALMPILMVISLLIRLSWMKHLFNLSSHSFILSRMLIDHLFVFGLSCLISSFILGFKAQRKGRRYGAIFGGTFSVFLPTVPLIVGIAGFEKAFHAFPVGGWYVWIIIAICFFTMVTCGALGGFVGERLAQRRIPKTA